MQRVARARYVSTLPISVVGRLRREKGMTQAELAQLVGLSPQEIGRIENRKTHPRWHVWVRLSEVFDRPIPELKER